MRQKNFAPIDKLLSNTRRERCIARIYRLRQTRKDTMTMDHCIPRTSTFITSPQRDAGDRCRRPTAPNPSSHSFRQTLPIGQKSFFFPMELSNRRIVARVNVCSPTANGSPRPAEYIVCPPSLLNSPGVARPKTHCTVSSLVRYSQIGACLQSIRARLPMKRAKDERKVYISDETTLPFPDDSGKGPGDGVEFAVAKPQYWTSLPGATLDSLRHRPV